MRQQRLWNPRPGARVHFRYAPKYRDTIDLHELTGTVLCAMRGRRGVNKSGQRVTAPSNAIVLPDGACEWVCVSWGQLYKEAP